MTGAFNDGYAYRAPVQRGGEQVLAFLAARYTHSGQDVWRARLAAGEVEVDGVRAQGTEVLRAGQTVVWHRPPWFEEAAPLEFGVLFEDAALLAVNKPAGLPTLPGGGFLAHTLLTRCGCAGPERHRCTDWDAARPGWCSFLSAERRARRCHATGGSTRYTRPTGPWPRAS